MKIVPAALVVLAALVASVPGIAADAAYGPPVDNSGQALETVVVTGSRIPRLAGQGPAPVTVITAEDIRNNGYATVSDVMSALTQNLGALDNNQYTDGFSPGAQSVDLRGLGPNHTLVLVNGRRIADYPQSYGGNSNFTDISNIPTSLIDHIEILSGSASAIYGSDAISGVINFILTKKADGTTVDFRVGDTQHGGYASQRLQISSGYSNDRFDSVFAVEVYNQDPLWAFQRSFTNSRQDAPGDPSDIYADPVFVREDQYQDYYDPGKATCAALSNLDHNSIIYAFRAGGYGNYCGSYRDYAYATMENGRKAVNVYGSATYRLNDSASLYLDLQGGFSHQISYNSPLKWQNSYILDNNSTPTPFFNQATGLIEQWQRQYFTIEENGGLEAGEIHNYDHTISLNTGLKGTFANSSWDYDLGIGFSQNTLESKEPALVSAKAQALYLGPSLGIDTDSQLNIYNAPISRLYTPLTVAQFRSITQDSIDNDTARSTTFTFTTTNAKVFNLPAGPVGFAGVAEYGTQKYDQQVDPDSLNGTYYGLHNTSATGSRSHFGIGAEFSAPITSQLTATGATRYDSYSYSGATNGKFTYQTGLEYRPLNSLMLRASFGTGFRAPDLSFVYSGLSGSSSGGIDYYLCRLNEPSSAPSFDDCSLNDIGFDGRSVGSTALKDETSTSLTYGFVFAPFKDLEFSADYYMIRLANEVEYQSSDTILREEADCRLGQTLGGQPVDGNSALCQSVDSQVVRNPATAFFQPLYVTSVLVLPINAAVDRTSGIDINARYHFTTEHAGGFTFKFSFTDVLTHTIQLFPGDPVVDELTDYYDYVLPRYKGSYSGTWDIGRISATLHGSLIGGIPNYDGTLRMPSTTRYNGSLSYRFSDRGTVSFIVDNLFDSRPQQDPTWISFPYYSRNWFDPIGRAFFVQLNYHLGGHAP